MPTTAASRPKSWDVAPLGNTRRADDQVRVERAGISRLNVVTGGESKAFPTVLVGTPEEDLRRTLALKLDPSRRHVIEADSQHRVLDLVRLHSRPIQVLLLDVMLDNNGFVASLKKYRPDMQVILMTEGFGENRRSAVAPEVALARAQDLLGGFRKVHTTTGLPTAC